MFSKMFVNFCGRCNKNVRVFQKDCLTFKRKNCVIFYLDLDVVKFDLLADALERADKSIIMHFASIEYLETVIKT